MHQEIRQSNYITLGELFYLLFAGTLMFAKGIGYSDGEAPFKVFLAAAAVFWLVKMCLTRYTLRELAAVAALCILGFLTWRISTEKASFVAVMTVVGMKDVRLKRVFQWEALIWTFCFVTTILRSLFGLAPTVQLVHDKPLVGFIMRDSLGFTHPNVLHISYIVLIVLLFYLLHWEKKTLWRFCVLAFVGNLYVFLYSISFTGFASTMAVILLILYLGYRQERTKAELVVLQLLMPICAATALIAPLVLRGRAFEIADKIVNTRFTLTKRYLIPENITLFGTTVPQSLDCSYAYCLVYYGVILFALFMLGYFFTIRRLVMRGRGKEAALVLGLVAAGFTEPFQFNFSAKNLILFWVGEYLFAVLAGKETLTVGLPAIKKNIGLPEIPVKAWKKRIAASGKLLAAGAILGILLGAGIGSRAHVPEYIVAEHNYCDYDRSQEHEFQITYKQVAPEVLEDCIQLGIWQEDPVVYVFDRQVTGYIHWQNLISGIVFGGLLGPAAAACTAILVKKKATDQK